MSSAIGTIGNSTFLDGQVGLAIAGQSNLQAFASGVPGGANITYSPGTVTVTVGSTTTPVALGNSAPLDVPGGRVVITVNQPIITESPNGRTATASVAVVTADIRVGPANAPLATAKVDLLPLRASAVAPPGGIECAPPAPVLNAPAAGSTITDTTPTFTGTAYPGAEVEIFIDGDSIGTTTANNGGNFSFTPTTPLGFGFHNYTAAQTTDGGTSAESNGNGFAIFGPPVLDHPADGTMTNDTTPTFSRLTFPGAQVDILVDGNPIGTTTANATGHFSFTPGGPLSLGTHLASAMATLNSVTSGLSNVNAFAIDTEAPAAPTLIKPADGEVTRDRTPTFSGRAEPGAEVEIFVDGASIGTTTANGDGDFSFTPTTALAAGPHEAFEAPPMWRATIRRSRTLMPSASTLTIPRHLSSRRRTMAARPPIPPLPSAAPPSRAAK